MSDSEATHPSHFRARETAGLLAALDCVPSRIVGIESSGRITHVNRAWREFVRQSGAGAFPLDGVGSLYLEVAQRLGERGVGAAAQLLDQLATEPGAAAVCEYRDCWGERLNWFRLQVQRTSDGVVLLHTDISDQRRAEAYLTIQASVSSALAERMPLVAACQLLMTRVAELFDWDMASVWVSDHWEKLLCASVWTQAGNAGSEFERVTRGTVFERGQGLPGRVWETRRPVWITDIPATRDFPRLLRRPLGITSGFATPLQCEGQVFAVLEFFSRASRQPDAELMDLLATAGLQLGLEELRQRAMIRAERAEAGASLTRSRLDAVMENAPGFIIVVDPEGRMQFINRVLAHHRRQQLVGQNWLQEVPPSEHAALTAKLQTVLASGVPQRHEMNVAGPDGSPIWMSAQLGPLREQGRIVGAVASVQDITDFKRTQAEFAAAQRWASVGTLAAGVAHEINTPIQFVNDNLHFLREATRRLLKLWESFSVLPQLITGGAAEPSLREAAQQALAAERAARRGFLAQEMPRALEACTTGLERVAAIVSSLKEFAQPAGVAMEPTDLNRLLERALVIAANEYKDVAELETHFGDLPPVVCQVGEMGQALLHLIVNAAHAIAQVVTGPKKGLLEVCTSCEQGEVLIAIRDNGSGIPKEIQERIFEPFFTTKEVGKGSGQGLAVAWSVIRQKHQGSLTFQSAVGEGTTFFVRLPLAPSPC